MKRREKTQKGLVEQKPKKFAIYDIALDKAEKLEFEKICEVEGIDEEIAILRIKIRTLLKREPNNVRLIMEATNTLARLVRTLHKFTGPQKNGLKEAMSNVVKEVLLPMGLAMINKKV